jgi:GMP synthase-like glutamine amidotransferase
MRILGVIHHALAGAGVFAAESVARGHEFDQWQPTEGPLPRPLSQYGAVMAFGGGMQADEDELYPWLRTALGVLGEALEREVPTLGVCLGGQMLARAAGGAVGPAERSERGWGEVEFTDAGMRDPLFAGQPRTLDVFQWHSYAFELPPDAVALACSPVCLQAFRAGERAWGLQWHPEVTADSILVWGNNQVPAPGDARLEVDLAELKAAVSTRIAQTNQDGRELCARFLQIAEHAGYGRTR